MSGTAPPPNVQIKLRLGARPTTLPQYAQDGQTVRVIAEGFDRQTGARREIDGVSFSVRQPGYAARLQWTPGQTERLSPYAVACDVEMPDRGEWRVRAEAEVPNRSADEIGVTIHASGMGDVPREPVLADETGQPIVLPSGGLITVMRIDRGERLEAFDRNVALAVTKGGAFHSATLGDVFDAAQESIAPDVEAVAEQAEQVDADAMAVERSRQEVAAAVAKVPADARAAAEPAGRQAGEEAAKAAIATKIDQSGGTMLGDLALPPERVGDSEERQLAAPKGWVQDGENLTNVDRFRPRNHRLGIDRDTGYLQSAADSGEDLFFPGRVYQTEDTLVMPPGRRWSGPGGGHWPLTMTTGATKDMHGAIIQVVETPTRKIRRAFMSDQRLDGGWVPNPSSINERDTYYKLTSWMNEDADPDTGEGATPRLVTAGIHILPGGRSELDGLRVQLGFDGTRTVNGYERRYSWQTGKYLTDAPIGLGTDCDIGVLVDNHFQLRAYNLQSVGYWRMYALVGVGVISNDKSDPHYADRGLEHCIFEGCTVQGQVGFGIRDADLYAVLEAGPNWIEFAWRPNHTFRMEDTRGLFRGYGVGSVSGSYSGTTTRVVNGQRRVRLTGCSPSTAGMNTGACGISPVQASRGTAGNVWRYGEIGSLMHASLKRATEVPGVALNPSACVELHGRTLRGISFWDGHARGYDDVGVHVHNAIDVEIGGTFGFENVSTPERPGSGMRVIASPAPSSPDARGAAPYGGSYGFRYTAERNPGHLDLRPISARVPSRYAAFPADKGLFTPADIYAPPIFLSQNGLGGPVGKGRGITDDAGVVMINYDPGTGAASIKNFDTKGVLRNRLIANPAAGQTTLQDHAVTLSAEADDGTASPALRLTPADISLLKDIIPSLADFHSLGRTGRALLALWARTLWLGNAAQPNLQGGAVVPNGNIAAPTGSLYLQQGGSIGSVWSKQAGSSDVTGWRALASLEELAAAVAATRSGGALLASYPAVTAGAVVSVSAAQARGGMLRAFSNRIGLPVPEAGARFTIHVASISLSPVVLGRAASAVTLAAAGTGYTVGDRLVMAVTGGTGDGPTIDVAAVGSNGEITALTVVNLGCLTSDAAPSAAVNQVSTTGAGSGATVTLAYPSARIVTLPPYTRVPMLSLATVNRKVTLLASGGDWHVETDTGA